MVGSRGFAMLNRRSRRAILVTGALVAIASPAAAVDWLQNAKSFAVLGASTVTNAGATAIIGDIGVAPGTSITGLETVVTGNVQAPLAVSTAAQANVTQAANALSALAANVDLTGTDLGALGVLTPGVYRFATSAALTGNLVLDFGAAPASAFVFQIGTTLTTIGASQVTVLNGSADSAIYWVVGTSATLGAGSTIVGNIIADQSIDLGSAARILCGRGLARGGAVTMITNLIANRCDVGEYDLPSGDYGSYGYAGRTAVGSAPEPATWAMLLVGFGLTGARLRRTQSRQLARA